MRFTPDLRTTIQPANPVMSVHAETDLSVHAGIAFDPALHSRSSNARLVRALGIFAAYLAAVVILQIASGAYGAEFGSYPDEPAHYVTSLMIREYLTGPHPFQPLKFAENYYAHYPKVAFGHWPPFFYVVQSVWMLLFSAARASVRLELACTTALLAFSVYLEAKRWVNENAGILAGFLVACLPLVQSSTDEEMAETLLVLTCFWSAVYLARYMDSERWKDALGFALFLSLAVLTKGSGWLLAMLPPMAAVLTRRIRVFFRLPFWAAVAVISAVCLPWQFMTLQVAARGWTGGTGPTWHYTSKALVKFALILIGSAGPVLSVLICAGIAVLLILPLVRKGYCEPAPAVMFALIAADWLFHSLVPAGVENRKMIMAVPAMVLFAFAGGFAIADRLPASPNFVHYRRAMTAAAVALCFFSQTFTIPRETHFGYTETARYITSNPELRHQTILASSESLGEGLLISEIAMRQPRPEDVIIRDTKALADVDWTGTHYRSKFTTPDQLLHYIQRSHIGLLVTDTFPPLADFSHTELLRKTIEQNPGHFRLLKTFSPASASGQIRVFQVE